MATSKSMLSSQKASDSGLHAILHPLVLLTISDYITRHTLREQPGPVVGALIGQQNGRDITIEHAFECLTIVKEDGEVQLNKAWFDERLSQMKTLYKSPQLDLVGWYTLLPPAGPTEWIKTIHDQILKENESALLLGFHPDNVVEKKAGSRLPLTIYESIWEETSHSSGEDKEMQGTGFNETTLSIRFRELPYSVETGEAEMISMDSVALGAGNATMVEPRGGSKAGSKDKDSKGKGKETGQADAGKQDVTLSKDDEEMIAALTAKANAIKMLQARIDLLATYLERLPPSLLSGQDSQIPPDQQTTASHPILRSIQALVSRLSLVVPTSGAFETEMQSETNDVNLMELLNSVMQSVNEVRVIGQRHSIVEKAKLHRNSAQKANFQDYPSERGGFLAGAGVI